MPSPGSSRVMAWLQNLAEQVSIGGVQGPGDGVGSRVCTGREQGGGLGPQAALVWRPCHRIDGGQQQLCKTACRGRVLDGMVHHALADALHAPCSAAAGAACMACKNQVQICWLSVMHVPGICLLCSTCGGAGHDLALGHDVPEHGTKGRQTGKVHAVARAQSYVNGDRP